MRAWYRALFRRPPATDFIDVLRAATNCGWAMGDEKFKREIAEALKRRVVRLPRGRPRKDAGDKRQPNLL